MSGYKEFSHKVSTRSTSAAGLTISVLPSRLARYLVWFAIGLLAAGVISHSLKYDLDRLPNLHRWFNTDGEKNFPAAFSAGLLLLSGVLSGAIAAYKLNYQEAFRRYWVGLSITFSFLAADEWLSFHEKLSDIILPLLPVTGIFHFAWIIAGLVFVTVFGLVYFRFMLHLPRYYRQRFFVAAGIFLAGAIGMEMVSGYYADTHQEWNRGIWLGLTTLEEGLEMLGLVLCVRTLLAYIQEFVGRISFCVRQDDFSSSPRNKSSFAKTTRSVEDAN